MADCSSVTPGRADQRIMYDVCGTVGGEYINYMFESHMAGSSYKLSVCLMCVLASWQATAPFLQLGAVGALTLLSWFVFRGFHKASSAG